MKDIRTINKIAGSIILAVTIAILAFVVLQIVTGSEKPLLQETSSEKDVARFHLYHYYATYLLQDPVACYDNYVQEQDEALNKCHIKMGHAYQLYAEGKSSRALTLLKGIREDIHSMNDRDMALLRAVKNSAAVLDKGFCDKVRQQVIAYFEQETSLMLSLEELSNE